MEYLILAVLVGLIPLVGLFVSRSYVLCSFWALLFTVEAFACGWGLSMIADSMAAWNRSGEPVPPYRLAITFGLVAALVSFTIAMIRPRVFFEKLKEKRRKSRNS
jgi:hypothetical protein